MPPRKAVEAAETPAEPVSVPPGPIQLEIRVNGKIQCLQRVYAYTIDQQTDVLTVTGDLRPASDG